MLDSFLPYQDDFEQWRSEGFPNIKIETKCSICGKPVVARMNQTNEDEYFVEEI